ncbi:hypothetical protein [Cytobacillus massiliigabonensis]|uniref:hypothetical protein n=1 Tax=Cytobacillus massiliigabonensis TaxID=1871011 RepID=UPI000C844525|nr:hypothetical protein [Cytobacillus massiliigabonensis]
MSVLLRRKRLPDGSFGELEKVFEGETEAEKLAQLKDDLDNAIIELSMLIAMQQGERSGV